MLEEFTPLYALSHVRGEMQPIVMPSPLFGEGGYGPYLLIGRTFIAGPL